MIPQCSYTFWMIFGTSKMFTKSGHLHRFFYKEMLQEYKTNMETFFKNIIFHISTFWKPKMSNLLTLLVIKNENYVLVFFSKAAGPKISLSQGIHNKRIKNGGLLIKFGNLKNWQTHKMKTNL